ncbi:MAG: MbnP family protein [Lentimicrobiaceae bacterium]
MTDRKFLRYLCQFSLVMIMAGGLSACRDKEPTEPVVPSGKIVFNINHQVKDQPLKRNELIYSNAAGNQYLITDVMYFISDVTFYRNDGTKTVIGEWKDIFYIDENIPDTKTIQFFDKIPVGEYDSISFIFGIPQQKNQSFMFVNPPEVNMTWPEVLGGGYHYMMINGKWKNPEGFNQPFDFHLGIGQLYRDNSYNTDSIYAFVQNYFTVSLPGSDFTMKDQDTLSFQITMDLQQWFENPHIFDFNQWGGAIMQQQPAMQTVKENGWNVFSLKRNF